MHGALYKMKARITYLGIILHELPRLTGALSTKDIID